MKGTTKSGEGERTKKEKEQKGPRKERIKLDSNI
jgi:hypothetical protein